MQYFEEADGPFVAEVEASIAENQDHGAGCPCCAPVFDAGQDSSIGTSSDGALLVSESEPSVEAGSDVQISSYSESEPAEDAGWRDTNSADISAQAAGAVEVNPSSLTPSASADQSVVAEGGLETAASAAWGPASPEVNSNSPVALDLSGDGVMDAVGIDTTNDGQIDTWLLDPNQDGVLDGTAADTVGDGGMHDLRLDSDHNGVTDAYGYDVEGDGVLDRIVLDRNEDGIEDGAEVNTATVGGGGLPGSFTPGAEGARTMTIGGVQAGSDEWAKGLAERDAERMRVANLPYAEKMAWYARNGSGVVAPAGWDEAAIKIMYDPSRLYEFPPKPSTP